jgi:hypothetical protein
VDRTAERVDPAATLAFVRARAAGAAPPAEPPRRTRVRPRLRDFYGAVANALRRGARTPER